MEATILEWLNLLARWVHVIAAIMWIGDSFLFMWMDSHLSQPRTARTGTVVGELWMVHSGGFYEVVKRKSLSQAELPPNLYWFKWESYTTWISGFLLLIIVYYAGGSIYLVDPAVLAMSQAQAVGTSLGLLLVGWLVYDAVWSTVGQSNVLVAKVISLLLLVAAVFAVTHVFPGRAAYLQVGAMVGTVMAANVFFRIIPAQKYMLAQTHAGQPVDTTLGLRAKQRSTHNHYLTLPVLFTMVSNHFPSTFGHKHNWVVLLLLMGFGAALKYAMNARGQSNRLILAAGTAAFLGVVTMTAQAASPSTNLAAYQDLPKVEFTRVATIMVNRCVSCHARQPANPAFPVAPQGVMLDTPERISAAAQRILARAVITATMPLGNMTGMLEEERRTLGAWVAQGASTDGMTAMPVALPAVVAPPPASGSPADQAKAIFQARCTACHGPDGKAETDAAKALTPRPRNLTDAAWHSTVTDEQLSNVIKNGGASVGKSALMPGNADLGDKPDVLLELVKHVRSLKAP